MSADSEGIAYTYVFHIHHLLILSTIVDIRIGLLLGFLDSMDIGHRRLN